MPTFTRDGLTFDHADHGPAEGTPVVLLHGWPGGAATWDEVVPLLVDGACRVLVPDQRGYSPGARPAGRRAYVMDELVADVVALLDAVGLERAHIVGHDWGGAVAWALGADHPARVTSLTVLSTPHPGALARAMRSSDQALRSSYIGLFQLPLIPEALLLARDASLLKAALRRSGLPSARAEAYAQRQQRPGALTAALGWYRAVPLGRGTVGDVTVPTRFVWGAKDAALGPRAAELTGEHVVGPYRFDRLDHASHWLPEVHPDLVANKVLDHIASVDPTTRG
jgi:pimeloyl-ACP methyl ester carboxylesterase